MQIYGILLNICGILLNNRGKTEKNGEFRGILWNFHGKYVENHSFLFLFFPQPLAGWPIFAVVFGHFRSFSRSFLEKIGEFRRISEKIGEYRGNLSVFIPFLSTSLHFHSSIPRFYALQHIFESILSEEWKFLAFFLAVSDFLLTFANGYKTIVNYPARRPLSPMAS